MFTYMEGASNQYNLEFKHRSTLVMAFVVMNLIIKKFLDH